MLSLHWKLRSFDWLLQVYYRLIAGVKRWGVSHKPSQSFVKAAKQEANGMHLAQIKGKMRCMKVSIPIKLYSFFNIHSLFMYI